MKFTANSANTERLLFNDLGKINKGVSQQEQSIALDAGESVYLPNSLEVCYSATSGDARKYEDASLLDINDIETLANDAEMTIAHNFKFLPNVTVYKKVSTDWVEALVGTDYTATNNAAMTELVVKNISGGTLDLYVNVG